MLSSQRIAWKDIQKYYCGVHIICSIIKLYIQAPFYIRVGGNTGFTRQYVESFLCRDGKPIYTTDQYKGDKSLLDVRKTGTYVYNCF